jgi:NDP-sugar pyrophosphorylase family protein
MSYQLVVLMSGKSNRFQEAGYEFPKALLYANSKMILNRIIDSFPNAYEVLVVAASNQKSFIERRITEVVGGDKVKFTYIEQHDLGPSESISRAKQELSESLPIVVTYCDFSTNLDDSQFVEDLISFDAGAIVFSGFHPHTIRRPKFGYVKADSDNRIIEFREKDSFSNDPLKENASSGIYSFKSKGVLLESIDLQLVNRAQVNGEYYLSLAINELVKSGKSASITFVDCFACWGTPEDFEDFNLYARIQELCTNPDAGEKVKGDTKLFLAGGQGVRSKPLLENYKALLPLSNSGSHQLWSRSAGGLVRGEKIFLVAPIEVLESISLDINSKVVLNKIELKAKTESSCETALIGLSAMGAVDGPVSIIASDNLVGFDSEVELSELDFDLLVWLAVSYPISDLNSDQYSWALVSDSDRVEKLSVKFKPTDGNHWYTIVGNFSFASQEIAQSLISKTIANYSVKQELHLEEVINSALKLGLKVKALLIPNYMSVGVPDEIFLLNYIKKDAYSRV